MTRVLITGITGQDGYYLAEECRHRGWEVFGLVRGQNNPKLTRLLFEQPFVTAVNGDLTDRNSLFNALDNVNPDYVFNLGAITYIPFSWEQPELTYRVNYLGVQYLLEECAKRGVQRFIQASTSEMYGGVYQAEPLDERSPMLPRSPYAIAKLAAHHLCRAYSQAGKLDAVSAIMFNHESPRRGENFVTRKITLAAARIKAGARTELHLGSLSASRDWGYAPEYMDALCRLAQFHTGPAGPNSYVIATGKSATVGDFARHVFIKAGLPTDLIVSDANEMRVNDVTALRGNASSIRNAVGWSAQTDWTKLADIMYEADARAIGLELGH